MLTRRDALIGAGALGLTAANRPAFAPDWSPLTNRLAGGRLGVAAVDLASGRSLSHDAGSRYPLCSTFKLPLAAAILARSAAGRLSLDREVAISRADLVAHAPVVEERLNQGRISVRDLCRGIMVFSDNAAANLLLRLIGGPAALTRFMRGQGDAVSRLDHLEPALNTNTPGDPADTTTPAAMLALARRLLLGPMLPAPAKAQLVGWMTLNDTGKPRLRAGLPPSWRAGDRTGTADGQTNDVLIAWPLGAAAPVLAACYIDAPAVGEATRLAVQAEVGRRVAALVG